MTYIILAVLFGIIRYVKFDNDRYYSRRKEVIERGIASGSSFDQSGLPIPLEKELKWKL
jgi:hypothetical protein